MDLPVNKAKVLRNYDLQKKWKVVCDQVSKFKTLIEKIKFFSNLCRRFQEKVPDKGSPIVYLDKLRFYLDPKGTKKVLSFLCA